MMGPAIDVTVNRNHIYQNAFDQLTEDKGELKTPRCYDKLGTLRNYDGDGKENVIKQ